MPFHILLQTIKHVHYARISSFAVYKTTRSMPSVLVKSLLNILKHCRLVNSCEKQDAQITVAVMTEDMGKNLK